MILPLCAAVVMQGCVIVFGRQDAGDIGPMQVNSSFEAMGQAAEQEMRGSGWNLARIVAYVRRQLHDRGPWIFTPASGAGRHGKSTTEGFASGNATYVVPGAADIFSQIGVNL